MTPTESSHPSSERERGTSRATRVVDLPPGPWMPPPADALMVGDGMLIRQIEVGGVGAAELLGGGDIAFLRQPLSRRGPRRVTWVVGAGTRVTLLSLDELARLPSWPELSRRLLTATGAQLQRASLLSAIVRLSRVEDRVAALLWQLAERWGTPTPEGILVKLELTHEMVGRLVGARRPTISLAFKRLAADGVLRPAGGGGWVLTGEPPL